MTFLAAAHAAPPDLTPPRDHALPIDRLARLGILNPELAQHAGF